jgi:hypothetical protein
MGTRPLSVTIIGWLLVVSAGFSLFGLLTLSSNPLAQSIIQQTGIPLAAHMALSVVGIVVTLISGYGVLKGFDWARLLYVGYSVLGLVIGLAISPYPSATLIGLVFLAVVAFFLFRPAANAWFGKTWFGAGSGGAPHP